MKRVLISSLVPIVLAACGEEERQPPESASAQGSAVSAPAPAASTPSSTATARSPAPAPAPAASVARAEASGSGARSAASGPGAASMPGAGDAPGTSPAPGAATPAPLADAGDRLSRAPDRFSAALPREAAGRAPAPTDSASRAGPGARQPAGARLLPRSAAGARPAGESALEHKVESGDTLAKIAAEYEIALAELQDWNPGVDSRRLKIGQPIRLAPPVPGRTDSASSADRAGANAGASGGNRAAADREAGVREASREADAADEYTVARGDTLAKIARDQEIRLEDLKAWNPDADPRRLQIGQKLRLAPPGAPADARG